MTKFFHVMLAAISVTLFPLSINAKDLKRMTPGDLYIRSLNHAGSVVPATEIDTRNLESIFAPTVKKFVNGICVTDGLEALKENWQNAREAYGTWKIPNDYQLFSSPKTNTVTVKHTAQTARHGTLLVIAILMLDKSGRITEIFEVYSPITT